MSREKRQRGRPKSLSESREDDVLEEIRQGVSYQEIGVRYGIGAGSIRRIAERRGIELERQIQGERRERRRWRARPKAGKSQGKPVTPWGEWIDLK